MTISCFCIDSLYRLKKLEAPIQWLTLGSNNKGGGFNGKRMGAPCTLAILGLPHKHPIYKAITTLGKKTEVIYRWLLPCNGRKPSCQGEGGPSLPPQWRTLTLRAISIYTMTIMLAYIHMCICFYFKKHFIDGISFHNPSIYKEHFYRTR